MMYLVTRMKKTCNTNVGEVDLATSGLCGMMPVFKDRQEAIAYALCVEPHAKVLEIEEINKQLMK